LIPGTEGAGQPLALCRRRLRRDGHFLSGGPDPHLARARRRNLRRRRARRGDLPRRDCGPEARRMNAARRPLGSLAAQLALIVAVFLAVPFFLYKEFEAADRTKASL